VLGPIPLASLTAQDVARWVQNLAANGNSGKTIQTKHGFLSAALKAAVPRFIAPTRRLANAYPGPNARRWCSSPRRSTASCMVASATTTNPFVEFLVASGVRFSAATALQPKDIDKDAATMRINRAWKRVPGNGYELGPPKTKKSVRTIGVPRHVVDTLDLSREWVFVNTAGNPVRIYGWRENVWYPALAKAAAKGLEKRPRVHDLRHTTLLG
jgi:integrase